MQNSSLITILKALSKEEIRSFEKFVDSPYFNTSEATTKLFKEIKKFYPDFEGKNFTKEYLFNRVYNERKFSPDLLKKLVSNLIKLSEEFIAQKGLNENLFHKNLFRLKQYSQRDLVSQFRLLSSKLIADLDKDAVIDDNYFMKLSEISALLYEHKFFKGRDDIYKDYIKVYDYSTLDLCYKTLTFLRGAAVDMRVAKFDYNESLLYNYKDYLNIEVLVLKVKKYYPRYLWVIKLFNYCLKCHLDPQDNNMFNKYKDAVYANLSKFTLYEQRNHLVNLLNLVTYRERLELISIRTCTEQKFDLLKLMIERGYIDFVGYELFINLCCRLKKYKEAENFIKTHSGVLKLSDAKQSFYYGEMLIMYHRKHYKDAIVLASKITINSIRVYYFIKHCLIKSYIELGELEQAYYLLDTFMQYINKNQSVSDERKERHGNFIRVTKKLLDNISVYKEFEVEKLSREITTLKVVDKDWLLEKISSLKENNYKKILKLK